MIGLLVAAIPAVELGKLHYRHLESAKITALRKSCGDFDKKMLITDDMKWTCSGGLSMLRPNIGK